MIVRRTIDKDELKELPKTVFPGRIYVIQSEAETEKAVAYLQSRPVIGIDSETRPSFTKGQSHKVALLQISSEECCFLFRLNMTGLTQPLVDLLENPAVIKVGLSLKDDFMMLHKRCGILHRCGGPGMARVPVCEGRDSGSPGRCCCRAKDLQGFERQCENIRGSRVGLPGDRVRVPGR